METSGANAVPTYKVCQLVRVDDVLAKFSRKDIIVSRRFFCCDDPHPPLFLLELGFGTELDNKLSAYTSVVNRDATVTSASIQILENQDPGGWQKIGDLSTSNKFELAKSCKLIFEQLLTVRKSRTLGGESADWLVIYESEYQQASSSPSLVVGSPDPSFQDDYAKLFDEARHTDVTFLLQGEKVAAHKCILEARCSYFKRMFQANLKENLTGEVEITDIEPEVFKQLLRFLYSGNSPKYSGDATMALLSAADKYGVDGLKTTCESLLGSNLDLDNAIPALLLTANLDCPDLKARAMTFVKVNGKKLKKAEAWGSLKTNPDLLLEILDWAFE